MLGQVSHNPKQFQSSCLPWTRIADDRFQGAADMELMVSMTWL
jgi:hypothetical protein